MLHSTTTTTTLVIARAMASPSRVADPSVIAALLAGQNLNGTFRAASSPSSCPSFSPTCGLAVAVAKRLVGRRPPAGRPASGSLWPRHQRQTLPWCGSGHRVQQPVVRRVVETGLGDWPGPAREHGHGGHGGLGGVTSRLRSEAGRVARLPTDLLPARQPGSVRLLLAASATAGTRVKMQKAPCPPACA